MANVISWFILHVILQGVAIVFGHENLCPPPTIFPNSEVQWTDRTLGAYATYTCRQGYSMDGPANTVVMYCNESGSWYSSITPECIVVRCKPPESPAFGNATLVIGDGEFGSVILYQCDQYYRRIGAPLARCLGDRRWSRKAPVCRIDCSEPSLPNGTMAHLIDHVCLEFSAPDDRTDWQTAHARCQANSGSLVIVHDEEAQGIISTLLRDVVDVDGTDRFWIGAEERSSAVQTSRNWQWVDGSLVENEFWGPDEPTSTTGSPSRGECVDLDPTTDYRWNDNDCSLPQRFICQYGASGICSDPGVPRDGLRSLLACGEQAANQGDDRSPFVEGCLLDFRCEPGYRIVGRSTSTCLSNGQWSSPLPRCERKPCPMSPPSENLVETRSSSYRGVAIYRCPSASYAVEGDAFAYCRQNSVWSMPSLVCEAFPGTVVPTTLSIFEPDWTFIGIVGALGILLLFAILVIIVLAAVRSKDLNRRKYVRPLPSTSAARKRRSAENTYYSIRQPIPSPPSSERSGQVELKQMKRLSDVSENTPTAVAQHSLTYDKGDPASLTEDGYLVPLKVKREESGKIPPRLPSGEVPLSPRSGSYDEVDDDIPDNETIEDDEGLLNNYIILLTDDEDTGDAEKKVDVSASSEVIDAAVNGNSVEVNQQRGEVSVTNDSPSDGTVTLDTTREPASLPKNGLEVPALTYAKDGFGSTVEL